MRFNMSDCNPVHVPGIGKELSEQPEGSVFLNETMTKLYQAIVGSLIFLTQCTRYDVAFSTMQAAHTWQNPHRCIWQRLKGFFDTLCE